MKQHPFSPNKEKTEQQVTNHLSSVTQNLITIPIYTMQKFYFNALFLLLFSVFSFAQNGIIQGRVFDPINNESIPFANVVIQNTTQGATTDIDGYYKIEKLEPGLYNIQASYIGYKTKTIFEIQVSNSRPATVDIEIEENTAELETVVVKASPFSKTEESPVSLRSISANEIQRNPGGNRDISKAIQSLPGVATTASFRNDILIRGGSPAENSFYIDGIEVPVINHFATQGASGGPNGMINVDFIKDVDFYAGAFPVSRGGALSSVFDFKYAEGNPDKMLARFTLGSSDAGITIDGPLGEKTNYIVSVRRSYLQFLFDAIGLPFLPTYTDYQYKIKHRFNDKNHLTIFQIGAFDEFVLNLDANETEAQQYLLDNLPVNEQWNYTFGLKYTHFQDNSYTNFILSRSMLRNSIFKYANNDDSNPDNLLFDLDSDQKENKLRVENIRRTNGFKFLLGGSYEFDQYSNRTFNQRPIGNDIFIAEYDTTLNLNRWGLFAQVSKKVLQERLTLSAGLRADGADYSEETQNMFKQLSPRFSASLIINERINFNVNTGIYYQLPPYTILGYVENNQFINKTNGIQYMRNTHYVAGLEWNTRSNTRITLEGFYKDYDQYPFLLNDSISFANLGGDFGIIGDEPVTSTSEGRTYGLELLAQQKLFKGFYGIIAYTLSWSEFKDKNDVFIPTAWDSRHIINLTAGYRFGKNWELGAKWRYSTGTPYTPYDENTSLLISNWSVAPGGLLDYDRLNSERIPAIHTLDFRIDKRFFFNKWNLQLYMDVQNAYAFQAQLPAYLSVERNEEGIPLVNQEDPSRYMARYISNDSGAGTVLPSIGVIVEF